MPDLVEKTCKACETGIKPLPADEVQNLLKELPEWSLSDDGAWIHRSFKFKNYYQTLAFVNAVAWMTHKQDHHPDMEVAYSTCVVRYSTHAVDGLSENDFICAAKVDALLAA